MEKNIGFLCFRKLKRLNLGGNDLTAVPQKALALLENLKKLEMQENRIATITEGDFAGIFFSYSLFISCVDQSMWLCVFVFVFGGVVCLFYEGGRPATSHGCHKRHLRDYTTGWVTLLTFDYG